MRKLLSTVAAIGVAGVLAYSVARTANIPLYSSSSPCFDSSQTLGCANQLITSINTGVTGNYAYVPGPVTNGLGNPTTVNQTLASATIPTGAILVANAGYRTRCSGIKSNAITSANFGIVVGRTMAVSLEAAPGASPSWELELQFHAATNPVTANYTWVGHGLASSPSGNATNFMSVAGGNDTTVTDNNVNFAIPITCVQYASAGGIATGSATMMNFIVEQLR